VAEAAGRRRGRPSVEANSTNAAAAVASRAWRNASWTPFLAAFSPNLRYLTGFTGSSGSLLVTPGESILFTDPRYAIQARAESGDCRVAIVKGRLMAADCRGHRQARMEAHRIRTRADDLRSLRIAEIELADEGVARSCRGLDRSAAHGEIAGRGRAHSPLGRDQFAGFRAGCGAPAPRRQGAGFCRRTGIPHAPPGSGETRV
jgi:hypothetical protein